MAHAAAKTSAVKTSVAKTGAKRQKKGSFGLKILGFLLLVLGMMALPSSMIFVFGMVPTGVAYLIDVDPRKTAAISVGTINACGVLPFEIALWMGANTMADAMQILGHVETWAVMYAAAALGWAIFYAVPPVIAGVISQSSAGRVQELERRQATLREAWGDEVGGVSTPA